MWLRTLNQSSLISTTLLFTGLTMSPPAMAASVYSVTDLGTLGNGTYSRAYGINNKSQVVGIAEPEDTPIRGFLYNNDSLQNLGTLPGGEFSYAFGINNLGQVVGLSGTTKSTPISLSEHTRAFLYSDGVLQNLGTLGDDYSAAYAINNKSQVVGTATLPNGYEHAFVYTGGTLQDLGTISSNIETQKFFVNSVAYGINNSGQVVGSSSAAGSVATTGEAHAFLYNGGSLQDLGMLPGGRYYSAAYGINNSGQVVGLSDIGILGQLHAFLYSGGSLQDLGTLGGRDSAAYGINDLGQVVGSSSVDPIFNNNHAFVYSDGVIADLNSLIPANSGWVLTGAQGINNDGQIVGDGLINGQNHAFLATPVPEPFSTLLDILAFSAVLGTGKALKRKQKK